MGKLVLKLQISALLISLLPSWNTVEVTEGTKTLVYNPWPLLMFFDVLIFLPSLYIAPDLAVNVQPLAWHCSFPSRVA